MKVINLIIFLFALNYSKTSSAQNPYIVGDTCDYYYTSYYQINDSVYKIALINGAVIMYEGYAKHIKNFIHLGNQISDNKPNLSSLGWVIDSLNIFRNSKGQKLEWSHYKNGKIIERKLFENDTLFFHAYTKKSVDYEIRYRYGKIVSTSKYYPDKHLLITSDETGKFKFGTGNYKYDRRFIYGNKTYSYDRINRNDKVITQYFDKTFIVKKRSNYQNGKLYYVEEFDIKKRPLKQSYYENGKLIETNTYTYSEDSNTTSRKTEFISKKIPQKNSTTEYSVSKKSKSLTYRKNENAYEVRYTKDTCVLNYTGHSAKGDNKLNIRIAIHQNSYHYSYEDPTVKSLVHSIQTIEDYVIKTEEKGYQMNPYFHSIFTDYSTTYLIKSLASDFMFELSDLNNISNIFNIYHQKGLRTDSIFKNGQLQYLIIRNKDTSILYSFQDGQKELIYDNFYLQIAKDQETCNLGIKTRDGQWFNNHRFDDMSTLYLDSRLKYFIGYNSGYVSIYDWKGNLIMKPTFGIKYRDFDTEENFYHRYLYSNYFNNDSSDTYHPLFLLNNTRDSIYGFTDINGNLVIKSPYMIRLINDQIDNGWYIELNNKRGYANLKGIVIPPVYEYVYPTKFNQFIANDSAGTYILDSAGNTLFNEGHEVKENNSDSNTLVFSANKGRTIIVYNLKLNKKVFEGNDVELKYLSSDYYKIIDNKTRKIGIAGRGFIFQTPFIYDEVQHYNDYIICKKGNEYEFYTDALKFLNKVKADTIFFQAPESMNFSYYSSYNSYYFDRGTNYPVHRFLFRLNNQMGLLNLIGEIIIPASYNAIAYDDFNHCYGIKGTSIDYYGTGSKKLSLNEVFPRESYTFIYEWRHHNKIKFFDWTGTEVKIPMDEIKVLTNNIYSISKNGVVVGYMNKKGELKFQIDSVQQIEFASNYYYYTNRVNKAGIMNCRFQPIFKSDFRYISNIINEKWVWVSNEGASEYPNQSLPTKTWRLANIQTGQIHKDTFYYPSTFTHHKLIVKSKQGMLGILDTNFQYLRPCIYYKYLDVYMKDRLIFQKKDSLLDVFSQNFTFIKTIKMDLLYPTLNGYIGFKSGYVYNLDDSFNVKDSSSSMFTDRSAIVFDFDSSDLFDFCSVYVNKFLNEGVNDETIQKWQMNLPSSVFNFYKTITTANKNEFTNNLNGCRVYFLPTVERYYNPYYDHDLRFFNTNFMVRMVSHGELYLNYSDFTSDNYNYQIEGYKDNYCTLSKQSEYESSKSFSNYCISDRGIYEITLKDLIDPVQHASFEQLLKKKITAIDDPEAPCLKKEDLLNTYASSFIFGMDGILVVIDEEYSFLISYKELETYLKK